MIDCTKKVCKDKPSIPYQTPNTMKKTTSLTTFLQKLHITNYHSVSITTVKRFESLALYLSIPPKLCR